MTYIFLKISERVGVIFFFTGDRGLGKTDDPAQRKV